tara:strand:+ start:344 stop:763 length:420 start_codon:yes stop_codon:yes gene_type:complete
MAEIVDDVQMSDPNDPHGEFKVEIKEWDSITNQIKEVEAHLKVLKKRKKDLQKKNIEHMKTHKLDVCNMPDGKICLKTSRTKVPVKKKSIPEKMTDFFMQDEKLAEEPAADKAERLYKHVYETNEFRINYRLTRSRNKN